MPTKSLNERAEGSLSGAYIRGYRKGQKDFAEKVKAEIKRMEYHMIDCEVLVSLDEVLEILDSVGKGDNE